MELIHSDIKGPFPVPSIVGNYLYFIIFVDDLTRFTWIFPLRTTRSKEVVPTFKWFKDEVEIFTGLRIRCFRCDNDRGEYTNKAFQELLKENHIEFVPSVPYHQYQNGISERAIRTIIENGFAMLFDAHLPLNFWYEAMATSTYLKNISPTSAVQSKTPTEAWTNIKPTISHLKRFGCDVHVLIPNEQRNTLQPIHSTLCWMMGYDKNTRSIWKVWDPTRNQMRRATSVWFDENSIGGRDPGDRAILKSTKMNLVNNHLALDRTITEHREIGSVNNHLVSSLPIHTELSEEELKQITTNFLEVVEELSK